MTINEQIKQASEVAREKMNKLDAKTLNQLEIIYKEALQGIYASMERLAGSGRVLRLEVANTLARQLSDQLDALALAQKSLIDGGLLDAAFLGVAPMAAASEIVASTTLTSVAHEAARFAQVMAADDGLILSDRLWRLDRLAKEAVMSQVQSSILQGHGASEAAQEFLARDVPIPKDIADKLSAVELDNLRMSVAETLMTGKGSPYHNALRVFRTELNRAHGEAYQASVFEHSDVIGTRFLLSPNHPRVDVCNMHATVNMYGLGAGVYPKGKNPWPAHPNTLSYTEAVFSSEVSDEDKAEKQSPIFWLKMMPESVQEGVLGQGKAELLREGKLNSEKDIYKPLNKLKG